MITPWVKTFDYKTQFYESTAHLFPGNAGYFWLVQYKIKITELIESDKFVLMFAIRAPKFLTRSGDVKAPC